MKTKKLPTHADEIDVLRLHNAALVMAQQQKEWQAATAVYSALLDKAAAKYHFDPARGEGINFGSRKIDRVPEIVAVKDTDGRSVS